MGKPYSLNVWSVGCSTGEEPYSIAMTVDKHMRSLNYDCYLAILASDISRDALAKGREGIYSKRQYDKLQQPWQQAYFTQIDEQRFQVKEELRQRICFNQVNILDLGKTPIGSMDVIICQNVLIYYDRAKRLEIVNELAKYLAPGGLIIFAVGEMLGWDHSEMTRFQFPDTLAYKRKLQ
jgi:chemotaxis protein methyltransferase CheR/type IV pilus assembly protein PilK